MLRPSDVDSDCRGWIEESDRIESKMVAEIEKHGSFAPGETMFATGHYTEDRLVWFDILTVTLDDIMRECAVPEGQREQRRLRYRSYAKEFLQHYDGPERDAAPVEERLGYRRPATKVVP